MGAAEKSPANFYAMANDPAFAVFANRGDRLNGTLETVEYVPCTRRGQFEGLVVLIATDFAFCHLPPRSRTNCALV